MKFNLLTQSDFARRAELELNRGKIQNAAVNMWCIPSQQTIKVQEFAHQV